MGIGSNGNGNGRHQAHTGRVFVIGTRKSRLALVQTESVRAALMNLNPGITVEVKEIVTKGDLSQTKDEPLPQIGGKGLFTAELEWALAEKSIDLAVHSLKDLPTEGDRRFVIGAVCKREHVHDVLVSREGHSLQELPRHAIVGSSSLRRESQLLRLRPDLRIQSIRGNIDTRISKVRGEEYAFQATVLAEAGLQRIGRANEIAERFSVQEMVPAPGQGALGVQCREDDEALRALLVPLADPDTTVATTVERAFLNRLNAGCNTPLGCYAEVQDREIAVFARALSKDGSRMIEFEDRAPLSSAEELGYHVADEMLSRGLRNLEL